ncbi:hypothetical protein MPH_01840 [Macrophomina phaseolina MS6]|uniref:Uncharacterized protein n=1 Tax=Macrophomina phaseolina (strain MS6) TaxID=1126212 RepID=K2S7H2_MACPH|nr:hypothetical protein MPH_01840 [Macrophomina phaseolina MS6]
MKSSLQLAVNMGVYRNKHILGAMVSSVASTIAQFATNDSCQEVSLSKRNGDDEQDQTTVCSTIDTVSVMQYTNNTFGNDSIATNVSMIQVVLYVTSAPRQNLIPHINCETQLSNDTLSTEMGAIWNSTLDPGYNLGAACIEDIFAINSVTSSAASSTKSGASSDRHTTRTSELTSAVPSTAASSPAAQITVEAGTGSVVYFGSLSSTALYTSVSRAVASACPQATDHRKSVACSTRKVRIDGQGWLHREDSDKTDGTAKLMKGHLELVVESSSYSSGQDRDSMIESIAKIAADGASGDSCYEASWMEFIQDCPAAATTADGYDHTDCHWKRHKQSFCNSVGFVGVRYRHPELELSEGPDNHWINAKFAYINDDTETYHLQDNTAIDCDKIKDAEDKLERLTQDSFDVFNITEDGVTIKCVDSMDTPSESSWAHTTAPPTGIPTIKVEAGTGSVVYIGTLSSSALYSSMTSALEKICPTAAANGYTTCNSDTVQIDSTHYHLDDEEQDGHLDVSVESSNYSSANGRDGMIRSIALAAQQGATHLSCYWESWRCNANECTHGPEKRRLCRTVGFAGIQYVDPAKDKSWIDAKWAYHRNDGQNVGYTSIAKIDCGLMKSPLEKILQDAVGKDYFSTGKAGDTNYTMLCTDSMSHGA